jgi:hypothetical protein
MPHAVIWGEMNDGAVGELFFGIAKPDSHRASYHKKYICTYFSTSN